MGGATRRTPGAEEQGGPAPSPPPPGGEAPGREVGAGLRPPKSPQNPPKSPRLPAAPEGPAEGGGILLFLPGTVSQTPQT